jgi:large subunit ribosomal protein L28
LKCELCGKSPQFGHNVSHSKRRTNRDFLPNVHRMTITINGQEKKLNICTRCLRTQYKISRKTSGTAG